MYQVLLVDDEPILQLGIRRMLEGAADYQICASARNGEEALQYLQAHPVDIVMTDLKMPVMDGITLIKELKRRQLPARILRAAQSLCQHQRTGKRRLHHRRPCLAHARCSLVDEQAHRISVYVKPDEVSKAIGKQGQNIRLASQMVGYEIDIYRDTPEEDVDLKEFADEIEDWVIEEFQRVGCDTAKSVLELGKEELLRRTDLEEETVDHVLEVLSKEFEN